MPLDDKTVLRFNAISSFVEALESSKYKKSDIHIAMYCRLVDKTTLKHESAIRKHVSAFAKFYKHNTPGVLSKTIDNLKPSKIKYSDKAYINVKRLIRESSEEEQNIFWTHLLTILATIDPSSGAKRVLLGTKTDNDDTNDDSNIDFGDSNEGNFLGKMMNELKTEIDPNEENPMAAVMKLFQGGYIQKLAGEIGSGMQDGSFDMNKMMQSVGNIAKDGDGSGIDMSQIGKMMGPLMGMMNQMGGQMGGQNGVSNIPNMPGDNASQPSAGGAPNMMNVLGSLMGGQNQNTEFLNQERARLAQENIEVSELEEPEEESQEKPNNEK